MSQTACNMSSALGGNIPVYIIVIISYIDYISNPGAFSSCPLSPRGHRDPH